MPPRRLALVLLLLSAGCWSGGPRQPLFGWREAPPTLDGRVPTPPPRPYGDAAELALIARLREAPSGDQRQLVVQELVARGEASRPVLLAALEEELLLAEIVEEALRRIDDEPPAQLGARGVSAPWVEDKHRLALDHYMAGDVYGALRTIDAILTLEPYAAEADKLQRLRRRALEKLIRETILVAEVNVASDVITPTDTLRGGLRLRNLSEEEITLRPGDLEQAGFLSVSFEELSPSGNRTRLHIEHAISLEDELEIPPGESVELPFPEGISSHSRLVRGNIGRYHLGGRLRPQTLLVGDVQYALFVPVLPMEILVLEPRDQKMAEDPATSFLDAIERGLSGELAAHDAGRRVFVCAILMAREDPEGTVAALISTLEGIDGKLSSSLCAALARVTGEPLGFTRDEWLRWWRLRQSRPQPTRNQ